jgi:hypothetical protein
VGSKSNPEPVLTDDGETFYIQGFTDTWNAPTTLNIVKQLMSNELEPAHTLSLVETPELTLTSGLLYCRFLRTISNNFGVRNDDNYVLAVTSRNVEMRRQLHDNLQQTSEASNFRYSLKVSGLHLLEVYVAVLPTNKLEELPLRQPGSVPDNQNDGHISEDANDQTDEEQFYGTYQQEQEDDLNSHPTRNTSSSWEPAYPQLENSNQGWSEVNNRSQSRRVRTPNLNNNSRQKNSSNQYSILSNPNKNYHNNNNLWTPPVNSYAPFLNATAPNHAPTRTARTADPPDTKVADWFKGKLNSKISNWRALKETMPTKAVSALIKQSIQLIITKTPGYHSNSTLSCHIKAQGILKAIDTAVIDGAPLADISRVLATAVNSRTDNSYQSAVTELSAIIPTPLRTTNKRDRVTSTTLASTTATPTLPTIVETTEVEHMTDDASLVSAFSSTDIQLVDHNPPLSTSMPQAPVNISPSKPSKKAKRTDSNNITPDRTYPLFKTPSSHNTSSSNLESTDPLPSFSTTGQETQSATTTTPTTSTDTAAPNGTVTEDSEELPQEASSGSL